MERKENARGTSPLEKLLKATDVAEILEIATKTVNKLVREGKLGCVQVTSKERRFTREQVRAYIDAQSKEVRIDTPCDRRVVFEPEKGGERKEYRKEKAKDSWASLQEEMSRWT